MDGSTSETSDSTTTGPSSASASSGVESSDSGPLATDDGTTDSDSDSGSTAAADESSDGSTGCVDECMSGEPSTCTEGGDAVVECVQGEDGCWALSMTDCGDAVCEPGAGCVALPASCAGWLAVDPAAADGVYSIDPDGLGGLAPFEVQCDMTTDGGGWTLVAFNDETTTFVEFDRSWQEYKDGFGALTTGDLGWLGNDRIHALTVGGAQLHVRHDQGTNVYADFSVADEAALYALSVSSTPESMDDGWFADYHGGLPFSTWDEDHDSHGINCAQELFAGWWYADCYAMSVASGRVGDQVYWRPPPPHSGMPLLVEWIGMWIR